MQLTQLNRFVWAVLLSLVLGGPAVSEEAHTATEWLPILDREVAEYARTEPPEWRRLYAGAFLLWAIHRNAGNGIPLKWEDLIAEEQADVEHFHKQWLPGEGRALIAKWRSGSLSGTEQNLEILIALAQVLDLWEETGWKLGRAGVGDPFAAPPAAVAGLEPTQAWVTDGFRALAKGYLGEPLTRTDVRNLNRFHSLYLFYGSDNNYQLRSGLGLAEWNEPADYDVLAHLSLRGEIRGDMIGRPVPDVPFLPMSVVVKRADFSDKANRREDYPFVFRPFSAARQILYRVAGYTKETDAATGRFRSVPVIPDPPTDEPGMMRLSRFRGRKIVVLLGVTPGDPRDIQLYPAVESLRLAYGDKVEFFAVFAGVGDRFAHRGYRGSFKRTAYGERPLFLNNSYEDMARYTKRFLMDAVSCNIPFLFPASHTTVDTIGIYGGDVRYGLIDIDGNLVYKFHKAIVGKSGGWSVLLHLNVIETELRGMMANGGRHRDVSENYFNPWEVANLFWSATNAKGLVSRVEKQIGRKLTVAVDYPYDKKWLAGYGFGLGPETSPWLVGRVVKSDAAANMVRVENVFPDVAAFPWYQAWKDPDVVKDEKMKPKLDMFEEWLARGEKPVAFTSDRESTVWRDGMAANLGQFQPGDIVSVSFALGQDLDKTVTVDHIRASSPAP